MKEKNTIYYLFTFSILHSVYQHTHLVCTKKFAYVLIYVIEKKEIII
jgi:hypothetical protein